MDKKYRFKNFFNRIRYKYRLIIMNETTFEERFAIRLSKLNVFVVVSVALFVSLLLGCFLVAYTPLREYIPGYGNVEEREKIYELSIQADSINQELSNRNTYYTNFLNLLSNLDSTMVVNNYESFNNADNLAPQKSAASISTESSNIKFLVTPLNGRIINKYNAENKHFGIDISGNKNAFVNSIADGVVVFSDWTLDGGKTIMIQHSNNIVSIYKHNSVLLKKQGESVFADNPVAMIGNTGEESSGYHLHFELWINQQAVNPEQYIIFN